MWSTEKPYALVAVKSGFLPKWPQWTFDREVMGTLKHPLVCGFTLAEVQSWRSSALFAAGLYSSVLNIWGPHPAPSSSKTICPLIMKLFLPNAVGPLIYGWSFSVPGWPFTFEEQKKTGIKCTLSCSFKKKQRIREGFRQTFGNNNLNAGARASVTATNQVTKKDALHNATHLFCEVQNKKVQSCLVCGCQVELKKSFNLEKNPPLLFQLFFILFMPAFPFWRWLSTAAPSWTDISTASARLSATSSRVLYRRCEITCGGGGDAIHCPLHVRLVLSVGQ